MQVNGKSYGVSCNYPILITKVQFQLTPVLLSCVKRSEAQHKNQCVCLDYFETTQSL